MNRIISNTTLKKLNQALFPVLARARRWPELGALVAFSTLFVAFSILAPPFLTLRSLTGVLTIVSELGIMTIGVAFLMITGEFDLSVGSVYALSALLFVTLANQFNSLLALLIVLIVAGIIGLLNGIIVTRARIPSFIATLGTMMLLRGMLLAITGGRTVAYEGDLIAPAMLTLFIGYGFRPSHFWFLALTLLFWFILTRTPYGNWVFATGGNKEVARAMGVSTDRVKIRNFIISAMLAGFSGCIVLSRFRIANVAFGLGMELEAIAAAVIGGTFLGGGYGTIIGTFFGVLIMGMMRTGLVMAGAPPYWYQAFVGVILIVAAVINLKLRRLEM